MSSSEDATGRQTHKENATRRQGQRLESCSHEPRNVVLRMYSASGLAKGPMWIFGKFPEARGKTGRIPREPAEGTGLC